MLDLLHETADLSGDSGGRHICCVPDYPSVQRVVSTHLVDSKMPCSRWADRPRCSTIPITDPTSQREADHQEHEQCRNSPRQFVAVKAKLSEGIVGVIRTDTIPQHEEEITNTRHGHHESCCKSGGRLSAAVDVEITLMSVGLINTIDVWHGRPFGLTSWRK